MTKLEAIRTVIIDDKNQPTEEQLTEARKVIDNAISEGYVLVPPARLMNLLKSICSEEIAKSVFLELTK